MRIQKHFNNFLIEQRTIRPIEMELIFIICTTKPKFLFDFLYFNELQIYSIYYTHIQLHLGIFFSSSWTLGYFKNLSFYQILIKPFKIIFKSVKLNKRIIFNIMCIKNCKFINFYAFTLNIFFKWEILKWWCEIYLLKI